MCKKLAMNNLSLFFSFSIDCSVEDIYWKLKLKKKIKKNYCITTLQIRAGQRSIPANIWPLTTHIYHVMIIVTSGFSKKCFLLFPRKSFGQSWICYLGNTSLFSFYLLFFTCCFLIILCINALHLFILFHCV